MQTGNDTADSRARENISYEEPLEESQHTQTQIEYTQLTQPGLTPDESSNLTPLSPTPVTPFGRLIPCAPSEKLTAVDFFPTHECYWLGRSNKCDITAQYSSDADCHLPKKDLSALEWGKSMISNRHCRIFQQINGSQIFIEDNSGNGTFINQGTHLRKGETRMLHSGDEICLINAETLRKKISSDRIVRIVLQQFSFVFVVSKQRKPCVNPRAMNYNICGKNQRTNAKNENISSSTLAPLTSTNRIETFYDMREVLGDGTSGQVRRAIHRKSGKERAVKVISLRRHMAASTIEREVSLLQSLDHPYIVKLVDVFVQNGVAMYLVMELVKGGDLFDCIVEKQRYSEKEARQAMRRLLTAIHYLHEESNIVHRDLKPENILCSSPTDVKLADFGLAKIIKADGLKTFCGTPAYFAPEVLQRRGTLTGQGRYGKPADIWSLGVILYILLTGKPPFDDCVDEPNGFQVDFESDHHIWSRMVAAKELVEQMLRQDPNRRLTVHQVCNHRWINIEDGDTHCHPLDDPVISKKKDFVNKDDDDNCAPCYVDETALRRYKDNRMQLEKGPVVTGSHTDMPHMFNRESGWKDPNSQPNSKCLTKPASLRTTNTKPISVSINEIDNNKNGGCQTIRCPLTKLNLNKRCNRFREQVINQSIVFSTPSTRLEGLKSGESLNDKSETQSPASDDKHQELKSDTAVEEGENEEDPILSQFSSKSSDVESLTDYSVFCACPRLISGKTETSFEKKLERTTKRNSEDKSGSMKISSGSSKRSRISNSKQTTLNAWLVKKG